VPVLASPAHAQPIARDGFTKRTAKTFLHTHAMKPAREMTNKFNVPEKVKMAWKWLYELSPTEQEQVILPVQESADRYYIICVGANDRGKDLVIGTTSPATVEITAIPKKTG